MTGQAFGPVIGGALNSAWGFRSIFWMLFVLSVIILSALLIFLPETHRGITGNGTIPLSGFNKPFVDFLKRPMVSKGTPESSRPSTPRPPIPIPLKKKASSPLAYIFEKDIAAILVWGAVAYTAWSMVTSSTTTMMLHGFPYLTEWQLGLCFLPNGFGCICGSLISGWLLDQSFRRAQQRYRQEHNIPSDEKIANKRDFPLVRARLRHMPLFSIMLVVPLALYGPSFEFNDLHRHFGPNLAAPLILQFLIAFAAMALFNINSTLLIDCFPERPASATALNNLCRCLLGAAGVSVITPLIDAVRVMKAFFIVTGAVLAFQPLIWVEWKYGERWRREREDKLAARDEH
jgi:predicted MFS family arabinose efflux permease